MEEIVRIQCVGLATRLTAIGCKHLVIGVSGGLDSTLALLVGVRAFDLLGIPRTGVHAITMPGMGTGKRTKTNADRLMEVAELTAKSASDYFQFTSRINDSFAHPQKIQLVENLWQIAYADAHLDTHENGLIGKIAELLHVTQGEYIGAKMRAKEASGLVCTAFQ